MLTLATAPLDAIAATTPPTTAGIPREMTQRITQAEAAFRVQAYPRVVELLQPLVDNPFLDGKPEHRQVLEWLGASHYLSGAQDAARLVFTKLIQEWPRLHLDELLYPPELTSFYDARRQDLIDLGVIDPNRDPNVTARMMLVREEISHDTPTIAYFAPFGVGQFANHQDGKGTVVVTLQALGLATTVATWWAIEGLKDDSGYVSAADESEASALNALWIAGATVFGGAYIYSVVDGLANRPAGPDVRYHNELIDIEDIPPAPDVTSSLRIGPTTQGVGVCVGLTF
ncbi:MAG: hypothetical protein CSA24_01450 [Deltaproteobacteria bacterium]|nr:MAG: hypothetical protein CSA24_01450 [Deltaproteobacteria bacterium]